jgi:hypothetical protein
MLRRLPSAAILTALIAGTAHAGDVIVNDRASDPAGTAQYTPHVALTTYYGSEHLVCLWEERTQTVRQYRIAVSGIPRGAYTWVQQGSPPAPAGYQWISDMMLKAPSVNQVFDGTFLIVGQVRATGGFPATIGLASVRGHALDENTVTWETPQVIETFGTVISNQRYINALTMNNDSYYTVYVGYINLNVQNPILFLGSWFRRSYDFGVTWSGPKPTGIDSTQFSLPTFQPGFGGAVSMFWYVPDNGGMTNQLMMTGSNDTGDSFGAPVLVRTSVVGNMSGPANVTSNFGPLPTLYDGTWLYVGEAQEVDHSSYTFIESVPPSNEIEPNDNVPQANTLVIGGITRGSMPSGPTDADVFKMNLTAGQTVMMCVDSTGGFVTSSLRGPDGSILCEWSQLQRGEFTAPTTNTYYLFLLGSSATYRLRTRLGTPPAGGSRDQRDVFLTRGFYGYFQPAVNVSAQELPAGYEENGITLAANRDGFMYMSFYDWSGLGPTASSRYDVARSSDGGQTWQPAMLLTTVNTNWNSVSTIGTTFGPTQDVAFDDYGIHYVWVDGRFGDMDIFSRSFYRAITLNSATPTTTSGHPGDVLHLSVQVHNQDDLWGWNPMMIRVEPRYRTWYLHADYEPLAASETKTIDYTFTVPDTAAPGDVVMDLAVHPGTYTEYGYNPVYDSKPVTLTVLAPLAVEPQPAKLELAAVAPNPAFHSASLAFSLSRAGYAKLAVYDIGGRVVRTLADGNLAAGPQAKVWNGANDAGTRVGAGAYFVQLEAEGKRLTRRMVWMR